MRKSPGFLACLRVVVLLSFPWVRLFAAQTLPVDFDRPTAMAFDAAGNLYVLEGLEIDHIKKVSLGNPVQVVATFASRGSGDGQLEYPQDIELDAGGNLVVVDSGNRRLAVFTTGGSFVHNVALGDGSIYPLRIVRSQSGFLYVLGLEVHGHLIIKKLNPSYDIVGTFDVSETCSYRSTPSRLSDLAIDDAGQLWVIELLGCGEEYTLRRYNQDGNPTGSWSRVAGQVPADVLAQHGYEVAIVSDIYTSGNKLHVVLGIGGSEVGGLDLDIWTTAGSFVRRTRLVGPARPAVRGRVRNGQTYMVDEDGTEAVMIVTVQNPD